MVAFSEISVRLRVEPFFPNPSDFWVYPKSKSFFEKVNQKIKIFLYEYICGFVPIFAIINV